MSKPNGSSKGMEPTEEMHESVQSVLDKAVLVETDAKAIGEDLRKMLEGTRHSIAFAKPYMDNRRYAKFDLTQQSSMSPINDALMLFNFVFTQYCAAQAKFSDLAKTCAAKVRALVRDQKVVDDLQQKPLVRYMDFVVGDTAGSPDSRSVSLPVGAIGVIVYQFPDDLRRSLWNDGQIDCTKIRVPDDPSPAERSRYREQVRKRGQGEGLEDPDEVYQKKMVEALLMIMSLRPRDMISFLVQGGGAAKMRCNSSIGHERELAQLLKDSGRMKAAIITYADISRERDCDIFDHAAYFSVVSAVRIFYRCMEHNCAIFDLRTDKRLRSMEELLAAIFLEDINAPQSDWIREQHDRWAIISEELDARMELLRKIQKETAEEERARLESMLEFRTGLGSTAQLLSNARQCASIIRAEMEGSYSTADDLRQELRENCMRSRWEKFRDYVNERTREVNDDIFPCMWRISKWYLRWQDHNIASPANMAAIKYDPFRGKNYWEATMQIAECFRSSKTASYMRGSGLFRSHFDEMYKNCHNALNLIAWPFTPPMEDGPEVRAMLLRMIFPLDGFYVIDARCETRMLRSADDFLLVLIEIAKRSGAQCNAVEAARFMLYTLESNGIDKERRHVMLVGSGATGKSTILEYCSKIVNGRGVTQSETSKAIVYEPAAYLPPFKDEDSGFKDETVRNTQAHLYTLFATQPHNQHDNDSGKDYKATTAVVNTREMVGPVVSQKRVRGGVISAQEFRKKLLTYVCATKMFSVTNANPLDAPIAVISRIIWLLFPNGVASLYEGASRALLGQTKDTGDLQYLRDLFALIFLAFHLKHCGAPYQPLFSAGAIESAFYGNISSPATDIDSPDTDVAAARRNRRSLRELSETTSGNASSCMDMNTSIYLRFGSQLEAEKKYSDAKKYSFVRFHQNEVDAAVRRFNVYLSGVAPATNAQAVGSGRADSQMSCEIDSRRVTGFVVDAHEKNYCGKSFDHHDITAAYPWMSVPRDPDSALDVIKGTQMSEFFQPGMLQATRSVIALVLFACTKWPDNVKFDAKTGYITLDQFFDLVSSTEEEAGVDDEPGGRLIPGPDPSSLVGTRFVMDQAPRSTKIKRTTSSSSSADKSSVDYNAVLKVLSDKNPAQMDHIKRFNAMCSQRYASPEIPEQFMMTFRLMLMRKKSSSVREDAPFINSVGMDIHAANKIEIHCMLFGLPLMIEHAINLLVHELRVPKVVLTYDVHASKSGQTYDRSPSALVLFPRTCDKQGFAPGSAYRTRHDEPVFPGLSTDADQKKVRKAFGVEEEKKDASLGESRASEELGLFLEFPQFSELFEFEQKLAANGNQQHYEVDDNEFEESAALMAVDLRDEPEAPEETVSLDRLIATDSSRADDVQREMKLGSSEHDVAVGALVTIRTLIDQSDVQSLQFAEQYISNPNAKTAIRELERNTSIDYQQTLGYRIATLAKTALGDSRHSAGQTERILGRIRNRLAQLQAVDKENSRVLSDYLRDTGTYVTRVSARDLKDLRVVDGKLKCLDVIGELARKQKQKTPVLFEPTVHDDDVIESAHNNRLGDVNSAVYSCTDPWIKNKIPMSFSLVQEEVDAVASQMLGYEYQPSHFTNYERTAEKTDKFARIKYAVNVLRPLFGFSTTLARVVRGELCYSNRIADSSGRSFMTASEYKGVMRGMLMDFLDLMIFFTRTTGLQSPYVDPSLCVFQSMQLGITWTHTQIMSAAMLLYSSIDPEKIRAAYSLQLDQWLDEVIAVTSVRRQAIIESRRSRYGSTDYLVKSGVSGDIDFSKDVSRLMFYPLPDDKTPDTETIKRQFVFSRRDNKPDVYRVEESKEQPYRFSEPSRPEEKKRRSDEPDPDEYVLTPRTKEPVRKRPFSEVGEILAGMESTRVSGETSNRRSRSKTPGQTWQKMLASQNRIADTSEQNGHPTKRLNQESTDLDETKQDDHSAKRRLDQDSVDLDETSQDGEQNSHPSKRLNQESVDPNLNGFDSE